MAATESNNVCALDGVDGSVIWQRNVARRCRCRTFPVATSIPWVLTGTPVIDLASRALFLNAMTTPDGGTTKEQLIFSINLDTGRSIPGGQWM
jgi:hypothetical protein